MTTLLLILVLAVQGASVSGDLQKELSAKYVGHTWTLYEFPKGESLRFSADGKRLNGQPGMWLVDGTILIESVKVTAKTVEMRGKRVLSNYIDPTIGLQRMPAGDMKIEFAQSPNTLAIIARSFIPEDQLVSQLPSFWQQILKGGRKDITQIIDPLTKEPIFLSEPDLEVLRYVHPQLTSAARTNGPGFQATVELLIIVNEKGEPRVIDVLKAAGLGLEESAMEAVRQWRFKTPTVNGQPSKAFASVRVDFSVR